VWAAAGVLAGLAALGAAAAQPAILNVAPPELEGDRWLNSTKPPTLKGLRGRVVILHFWTYGCINCKRNLPSYGRWQREFTAKGVALIGVHTPETDDEREEPNVRAALKREGITYPVLLDPDADNWRRWGQKWWPTVYLIDRKGRVRYRWEGELEWQGAGGEKAMAARVRGLLREK